MTKQEILEHYQVNEHGVITSPGKFEGEMLYVPYFWDLGMNGFGDTFPDEDESQDVTAFLIQDDDIDVFSELADLKDHYLYLWEDSQGFVNTDTDELK